MPSRELGTPDGVGYRDQATAARIRVRNLEERLADVEARLEKSGARPVAPSITNTSARLVGMTLGVLHRLDDDAHRRAEERGSHAVPDVGARTPPPRSAPTLSPRHTPEPTPPSGAARSRPGAAARTESPEHLDSLLNEVGQLVNEIEPSPAAPPAPLPRPPPGYLEGLLDEIGDLIEQIDTGVEEAAPSPRSGEPTGRASTRAQAQVDDPPSPSLEPRPHDLGERQRLQEELRVARLLLRQLDPLPEPAPIAEDAAASATLSRWVSWWRRLKALILRRA